MGEIAPSNGAEVLCWRVSSPLMVGLGLVFLGAQSLFLGRKKNFFQAQTVHSHDTGDADIVDIEGLVPLIRAEQAGEKMLARDLAPGEAVPRRSPTARPPVVTLGNLRLVARPLY